jgi:hypothetical protein
MINILGYGITVAFFTFVWTIPIILLGMVITYDVVKRITRDKKIARKVIDLVYYEYDYNGYIVFKLIKMHELMLFISTVLGAIYSIGLSSAGFDYANNHGLTWANAMIELIHLHGTTLAPVVGWVAFVVLGYAGFIYIGRRAFDMYTKVSKLLS